MAIPARIAGETDKSYQAFCDYCELGLARSLESLIARYRSQLVTNALPKPPTDSLGTLKRWSYTYDWQKRLPAYEEAAAKERDEVSREVWAERRREILEADYQLGKKLRDMATNMAEQLAQVPFTTQRKYIKAKVNPETGEFEPAKEIIRIAPNFKALQGIAKLASDLQRAAADIRPGIDVTSDGKALGPAIYLPAPSDLATPDAEDAEFIDDAED